MVTSSPGYPSTGLIEVITGVGTTVSAGSASSSHEKNIKDDIEIRVKTLK
jgi:hypothetical protein